MTGESILSQVVLVPPRMKFTGMTLQVANSLLMGVHLCRDVTALTPAAECHIARFWCKMTNEQRILIATIVFPEAAINPTQCMQSYRDYLEH